MNTLTPAQWSACDSAVMLDKLPFVSVHDIYTYIHSNISNNIVGSVRACMCACVRACVYCCKHNQEALPVRGAWPRDVGTRSHFLESPKKLTSREPHGVDYVRVITYRCLSLVPGKVNRHS